MSWLRLDDGFDDHPKLAELEPAQAWVWVRVLLYCARYRTSGKVTVAVLRRLCAGAEVPIDSTIDKLLVLELLEEPPADGRDTVTAYLVHDWDVYNGARTGAERTSDWRDRKYGEARYSHGGRRGSYPVDTVDNSLGRLGDELEGGEGEQGANLHGYVKRDDGDDDVTSREGHHVRAVSPSLPHKRDISALDDARATGRGAGYVEGLSRYTGARIVRGEGGISHVYDPLGSEPVPADWPHPRPTRQEVLGALAEKREREAS